MKTETLSQSLRRRLGDYVGHHARIARETGVPQTTISRIYCGTSSPTARNMDPLLQWLDAQDDLRKTRKPKASKYRAETADAVA